MNIKVIGIGGIGTCLLPVLLRFLNFNAPDITVTLVDGDSFEESNQERQAFDRLGHKATATVERFREEYPRIHFHERNEYVTERNIVAIVREEDTVFLCVDNHATRKLVSDRCEELSNVCLISGGNDVTDGSVHIYLRKDGADMTLPLANDFHPEILYPQDSNPGETSCTEQTPNTPQLLLMNNLVAAMMLSSFYSILRGRMPCDEVYLDLMSGNCRAVHRCAVLC